MALFSSKKNKEEVKVAKAPKESKVVATKVAPASTSVGAELSHDLASLIVRPRVTEKATLSSEAGVYVFEVSKESTKARIAKAISAMYKVSPVKVRVVNLPAKSVFVRGKWGTKTAVKKAYVYLKKGDKIEII